MQESPLTIGFCLRSMALAAQLQQDEYDAEDHARQQYNQQNNNNNNRQSIQVPVPNINDSSRSGRRDVSSSSSSAGHREQIQGSPGGRRTEDLHPKLLSGLGAKAPKKSKEKVGSTDDDDKKKKKPGCIIS